MSMVISFGSVEIYNEEFLSIKSPDQVALQDHVKHFSCLVTATTRSMASILGKVVRYYKKAQPIT